MCGIFGAITKKKNVVPMLMEGIKKLEYRGYDSWGIGIIDQNGKLRVYKKAGKIPEKVNK